MWTRKSRCKRCTRFFITSNIKYAREWKMGNEKKNMYNVLIAYENPTTLEHQIFVTKNASTFYQYALHIHTCVCMRCSVWWLIKLGALNVSMKLVAFLLFYYYIFFLLFSVVGRSKCVRACVVSTTPRE